MQILPLFKTELEAEYNITRQFFGVFPAGKNDYAPHQKSMNLMPLATHIAEIFGWPGYIIKSDKIDFSADNGQPHKPETAEQLMQMLDDNYNGSIATLSTAADSDLTLPWSMYAGSHLIHTFTKYEAIRHAFSQITHHRAQLGVYYRLLGIPLPQSYGPTADTAQ